MDAEGHDDLRSRLWETADGASLASVARAVGYSRETIRRYFRSGRPSVEFVVAYCRAFNVNPTWLLLGVGPRKLTTVQSTPLAEFDSDVLLTEIKSRLGTQHERDELKRDDWPVI